MSEAIQALGRYTVHSALASGGMATVHLGRLRGPVGFSRAVAIKRLLPQYAADPDFVAMFVDEARLASRIHHPNVVQTLDVVTEDHEIFIVMEYVHGETLSRLIRAASERGERMPPRVACRIARDMLAGLQAAHDAKGEDGEPLGIIHRDVSPQNVIVGADGIARLLDFGVAKARGRAQVTRDGQVKGKLSYMAPEQILGRPMTRSVDVFAAAIVLWEALAGRRLFQAESEGHVVHRILEGQIPSLGGIAPELARFDAVLAKGLARAPEERFASARELAQAVAEVETPADDAVVGEWVKTVAAGSLAFRNDRLAAVERDAPPPSDPTPTASLPATELGPLTGVTVRTLVSTPEIPTDARRSLARPLLIVAAIGAVSAAGLVLLRGGKAPPVTATAAVASTIAAAPPTVTPEPAVAPPPSSLPPEASAAPEPSAAPAPPRATARRKPPTAPPSKPASPSIPDRL